MRLMTGSYITENSDLEVIIHKIQFQNNKYAKVKASLYNKYNGIFYEKKNYKLYKSNIQHWKRK